MIRSLVVPLCQRSLRNRHPDCSAKTFRIPTCTRRSSGRFLDTQCVWKGDFALTRKRFSGALSGMREEGRINGKDRSRLSASGDASRLRFSDRSRAPPCHGGLPPTTEPTGLETSRTVVGIAAGRQAARRLTSMAFSWKVDHRTHRDWRNQSKAIFGPCSGLRVRLPPYFAPLLVNASLLCPRSRESSSSRADS